MIVSRTDAPMTFRTIAALFVAMTSLAILPGPSVFAVIARSITSGWVHGLITIIGIVVGDFIFILLALTSLSTIATTLGSLFVLIKYLGSAYLIGLAILLWQSKTVSVHIDSSSPSSWFSSFLSGLLITLGDPKALLFYVSFFPAFIHLSSVSTLDIAIILMITTLAVGGPKLCYAYMADQSRRLLKNPQAKQRLNRVAATVMIITAIALVVNA